MDDIHSTLKVAVLRGDVSFKISPVVWVLLVIEECSHHEWTAFFWKVLKVFLYFCFWQWFKYSGYFEFLVYIYGI